MTPTVIAGIGAAPVLPAISTLGAVLAFALAFALSVLWFNILRGPVVHVAQWSFLRHHPFGFLSKVIENVDHWINATVAGTERAVTWSLHGLMWAVSTEVSLLQDATRATWQALEWERKHTTRHVSAPVPQSIEPRIKKLEGEWKGIDARVDDIEKHEKIKKGAGAAAGSVDSKTFGTFRDRVNHRLGSLEADFKGIDHVAEHAGAKAKPAAVPVPRAVPRVVPRTKAPSRTWTDTLTKAAAAALVAATLARWNMSWLRCNALSRMGRKLGCGGFSWLEGFFATAFEAMVVLDLCKFALAAQRLARLIVPQLAGTLLVQNAVCLGGGASYPSMHDSPKTLTRVTLPSAHD